LVLCLTGCGGGGRSGPVVKGTITMEGAPLAQATVEFAGGDPALGGDTVQTDDNGKFEIRPDPQKSLLKPGKYYVRIWKWVDPKTGKFPEGQDADFEQLPTAGKLTNLVPERYGDRQFPEKVHVIDIKSGDNDFTLDVKKK